MTALLGCVVCAVQADALDSGQMAVDPCAQGGIGCALMAAAEGLARDLALPCLRRETRVDLVENHATVTRLEFLKVAENAHAGVDPATSVTMEKPLW